MDQLFGFPTFLHQNFCTKLFHFFTPIFYRQKIYFDFYTPTKKIFTPKFKFGYFYTKNLVIFTPKIWLFLHQKFGYFYTKF